jgi:hypothetical protein
MFAPRVREHQGLVREGSELGDIVAERGRLNRIHFD